MLETLICWNRWLNFWWRGKIPTVTWRFVFKANSWWGLDVIGKRYSMLSPVSAFSASQQSEHFWMASILPPAVSGPRFQTFVSQLPTHQVPVFLNTTGRDARKPFRMCVDPVTGWIYYGDVGPDATNSAPTQAAARWPAGSINPRSGKNFPKYQDRSVFLM